MGRSRLMRVVVAHDLSPAAARAARRAALLPLGDGARVVVVHVAPPGRAGEADAALARHAGELGEALRAAGARVEVDRAVVEDEAPHAGLIRQARAAGAELVVLGRHDERLRAGLTTGATAERVVRLGELPVLVVGAEPRGAYERPVAAVDLSDASRQVVDLALTLLPDAQPSPLTLLHAYHVPFQGSFSWALAARQVDDLRQEVADDARARADRFAAGLEAGEVSATTAVAEGEPYTVVLRELVRRRADLVVLGTHGRSGLSRAVLGSVAESVLEPAPCDVAVTRPLHHTFDLP